MAGSSDPAADLVLPGVCMQLETLRNRVQCHIFLGALPEGLEDAEKCIELDPTYLMGYACKAKVQALMQNYESAMATYIEGLKCDPNSTIVIDGFKRCVTCIEKSKGGGVGAEDLEDILRDWHSDIYLSNELKKYMEEVAVFKKEASDERLRRIESEQVNKQCIRRNLRVPNEDSH